MPSIINSDDGVISGTSGLKTTGGNDGVTTFQQNGTERMRINSTGEVIVGGTTGAAGGIALTVENVTNPEIALFRNDTTVSSGNLLGAVNFYGNDTTSNIPAAFAQISARASGTHAAGDNPTDLVFFTTPDNSAAITEEMRLTSEGALAFGGAANYGTAGQVLTSQGNASPTWTTISSGGATGIGGQVFTSSGTFTVPSGVTAVKVTVVGGGGAGGGCSSNSRGGGSGGGAGVAVEWITGLTPGGTVAVTVGTGGVGGTSTGPTGGTSSFGAYCSATGGVGGTANISSADIAGAAGGTGSGGTLNFSGGAGGRSTVGTTCTSLNLVQGGGGGSGAGSAAQSYASASGGTGQLGFVGGAGASGVLVSISGGGTNGTAGNGYGNGGTGATRFSTGANGGNGSDGIVIVEY